MELQVGRSIILLRGLGRGCQHWGDFPARISQAFPYDSVVAIDLAGNGQRYREKSPATIEQAVLDIREQLQSTVLPPPYYFIGLSLGGMIVLQAIQSAAIDIKKAIIINVSHAGLNPFYYRLRFRAISQFLVALVAPVQLRETIAYRLTCNNHSYTQRKETVSFWCQLQLSCPVSAMNLYRQIKIAMSFRGSIAQCNDHVVLLASARDNLVNPLCSDKIANYLVMPLFVHDRAGHDIPYDDPQWVIEQSRVCFNEPKEAFESLSKLDKC